MIIVIFQKFFREKVNKYTGKIDSGIKVKIFPWRVIRYRKNGLTASELLSAFRLYLFPPHPVKETIPGRLEVARPRPSIMDALRQMRDVLALHILLLRAPLAVGHKSLPFTGNLCSRSSQRIRG